MKYRLVQCVDGQLIASDFAGENVYPAMEVRGFAFKGAETNPRLRVELLGEPKFSGVIGPMWGGLDNGEVVIRYEDQNAYARLSA